MPDCRHRGRVQWRNIVRVVFGVAGVFDRVKVLRLHLHPRQVRSPSALRRYSAVTKNKPTEKEQRCTNCRSDGFLTSTLRIFRDEGRNRCTRPVLACAAFSRGTVLGRLADEPGGIIVRWGTEPKLKTRSRRQSNTRLSNRRFCVCWTIRKFSRKSSPCSAVGSGKSDTNKRPSNSLRRISPNSIYRLLTTDWPEGPEVRIPVPFKAAICADRRHR